MGLEKNAPKKQEPRSLRSSTRRARPRSCGSPRRGRAGCSRRRRARPHGGDARAAALLPAFLYAAVRIRLFAVINYGYVIHEFDPWFNYRAAEYMVRNGWDAFQAWYDHECWYLLGRHVGSTTYPGSS